MTDFYVPLYRGGKIAAWTVIDVEDVPLLAEKRWLLLKANTGYYAGYYSKGETVLLHRLLLRLKKGDGLEVDHKDRDRLNNRRHNVRVVTRAQNNQNRGSLKGSSSQYRGVTWFPRLKKWMAYIQFDRQKKTLGYFADEREAADVALAARRKFLPFSVD